MKYDITSRMLSERAKDRVTELVGKRGNAAALIEEIETKLKRMEPRAGWEKDCKRRRNVKHHAKSLLNTLECMRPELKHEVNEMLVDDILGLNFNQILDHDFIGMLTASLRARIEGQASGRIAKGAGEHGTVKASYEYTKDDLPSLNVVDALARAWRKHTRLAVSYADKGPFMDFVSHVLTDTGKKNVADPRRIIKRVLKTNSALHKEPKK